MNIANVTDRFALISGLDKAEMYKWRTLIDDSCEYISSHLIKEELSENDKKRVEMLTAVYALRLYCMCKSDSITSFTAGDVKLTLPDGSGKGEKLWQEYLNSSRDLISVEDEEEEEETEGFLFGRVI